MPGATAASRDENSGGPAAPGYRDGQAWVTVTRTSRRPDGRWAVACQRRGRTFDAVLGAEALVRLAPTTSPTALRPHVSRVVAVSDRRHIYRVRSRGDEDGLTLARRLSQLPIVTAAMPDLYLARKRTAIDVPPDDPRYSAQWYLERLDIERAWAHTTGRPETIVVVVDGGCDMDHPDLAGNFAGGIDLVDDDDDPTPLPRAEGNAHGTACAGIIAATGDNGVGITGVCPECTLHCLRLYGQGDKALVPVSADIAAFEYAFDVGAAVVSNSWGFADPMPVPFLLRDTIESLVEEGRDGHGALVVFAAGNENRMLGDDELVAVDGVLNVGAINNFDEAAPFSNYGPSVDLTAPTGTVTTDIAGADGDDPGDYTDLFGGTSSACPVVAGVAALLVSADPDLTAREASDLLIATARDAPFAQPDSDGHDPIYGFGIVDPVAAVRSALGLPATAAAADAGPSANTTDAGDGGDTQGAEDDGRRSGCSCTALGGGERPWRAWAMPLLVVALLLCKRRRALQPGASDPCAGAPKPPTRTPPTHLNAGVAVKVAVRTDTSPARGSAAPGAAPTEADRTFQDSGGSTGATASGPPNSGVTSAKGVRSGGPSAYR